jgi:hypothetical protein
MGVQNSKLTRKPSRKRRDSVKDKSAHHSNVLVTKTIPFTDEYTLLEKRQLGSGINGNVLLCQNKKTNQRYALKVRIFMPVKISLVSVNI